MAIAVLDVGKTNAKVLLLDEAGETLAQRARPCAVRPGRPTRSSISTVCGPGR